MFFSSDLPFLLNDVFIPMTDVDLLGNKSPFKSSPFQRFA
jgi:hypothetical protein